MIDKLPSLATLMKQLQQVPYLATKNVYRVINYLLTNEEKRVQQLCNAILQARAQLIPCQTCFAWQEKTSLCLYCGDIKREQTVVCVVETWQDLMAIEKTGGYKGVYHILGGAICPLEGIGPENLTINQLVQRIQEKQVTEIILATNQSPEGEATAAYIATKVKHLSITVSCLARGIPVGSSLEFMDKLTVFKALSERRLF